MTTDLATKKPADWATMKEQATMMIKSGFLPPAIKTPEQVIAIAMTGRELGVGMMESIRGVNVIQGKPTVSPQLMLALARRTGELENIALHAPGKPGTPTDATGAECHIKRRGQSDHVTVFGPAEAKAMGLSDKDNYKKQAATMYQWRALSANLRFTFSDAVSGLYTPEEIDPALEVNEEGSIASPNAPATQPPVAMPQEKAIEAQVVEAKSGITHAQRALLFKLAREVWKEDAEKTLKGYIEFNFKAEGTSDLTQEQFDQTITTLKDLAQAAENA
jgi:hypothetical protein